MPKRPEKRLKLAVALASTRASLQAGSAPISKLSAKTVVAPCLTLTLSMPQLSLPRSSSPPSLKRMLAVALPAVKSTITWRCTESV